MRRKEVPERIQIKFLDETTRLKGRQLPYDQRFKAENDKGNVKKEDSNKL